MHRPLCAVALIVLAGCGRCGAARSAASAEELLPQAPQGAAVTAPLGVLAQHASALVDRASSLPGGDQLTDLRKGLATSLGFDPSTREGLLSAGIDPDRGAALAILGGAAPGGAGYAGDGRSAQRVALEVAIALPLTKPDLFLQTAQRLLVERAGYAPSAGHPQVYERRGVQLGLAVVRGYGVIVRGPDAAALLAEAARRKPEESLAKSPGLTAVRGKLGTQDLLLYAPAGSQLAARYGVQALPGDAGLAVTSSAQGLALRLSAQLPPEPSAKAQAALPGGGSWLMGLLPPEAAVHARLGVSAPQLLSLVQRVPQLAPFLAKVDLMPLLEALAPGASLSLGVEKSASLAHLVDYGLDVRRETPFQTVQMVALAEVADAYRFSRALSAVMEQLPALGAKATRVGDDFQIVYAGGKGARVGMREIEGHKVAFALGGAIEPGQLTRAPPEKDPEAAALTQDPGAAARADFGKLYAAVHALPDTTYGSGPQSYVTRSLVGQVIDPLQPLRVSLAVQVQQDSLGATLDLELAAR
jgi:hypothetical protein